MGMGRYPLASAGDRDGGLFWQFWALHAGKAAGPWGAICQFSTVLYDYPFYSAHAVWSLLSIP